MSPISWYNARLKSHPLITNMFTSATIAGCGDVCAQTVFRRYLYNESDVPRKPATETHPLVFDLERTGMLDLRRSLIFMSFSFLLGTPLWSTMYGQLDKRIPGRSLTVAFKKGMGTWGFGFLTSPIFISYITSVETIVFEQKTVAEAMTKVGDKLVAKISSDLPLLQGYGLMYWSIHWIPLFYLLPPHVRLLYSSFCQVGWSTISSWIVHRKHAVHPSAVDVAGTK